MPPILQIVMASSTQTVVEEDSPEEISAAQGGPVTVEESADRLEGDGHRSSWPDVIDKATEISLNIGGLQANLRIGVVILLVLVLISWFIAGWSTSSPPRGSHPSDAPTLDLSDLSPVNVSAAENTKGFLSLDNKDSTVVDGSKARPMQNMSISSRAIAGFSDREVSQDLEKAVQDLRYATDQNEQIEEPQAPKRDLILKAYQEAVEETVQTLKKKIIRSIAWVSIALAIADFILLNCLTIEKPFLRLYWYRGFCTPGIDVDEPHSISFWLFTMSFELQNTERLEPLDIVNPELQQIVSPEPQWTVRFAFGGFSFPPIPFPPKTYRMLLSILQFQWALLCLVKQGSAEDMFGIAACGMSLGSAALDHTSSARLIWLIVATIYLKVLGRFLDAFRTLFNGMCSLYRILGRHLARTISHGSIGDD